LARNSSSQSNAKIKSDSEFTSSFQLKSAQPGADFYDLQLNSMLQWQPPSINRNWHLSQ
jgi:hypothetical protein